MTKLADIQSRLPFRIGRKKVGEILTHKNGEQIVLLNRSTKDVERGKGNVYISHGIADGIAAWPVETLVLSTMRLRGIRFVGIRVRETKDIYITTLRRFVDHSVVMSYRKRNGSMQRSLPFQHWGRSDLRVKL